jgi:predicted nucleic acid-binding protein
MNPYFDASVLVAFAVKGHPHHVAAFSVFDQMVEKGIAGYVSAHGLVEVYSVLTRAPFVPPVYPAEAWQILEASILAHVTPLTLDASEHVDVLRRCAEQGWTGGRVFDVLHLACAKKQNCDRIYTFNVRHFRALATPDLVDRIVQP